MSTNIPETKPNSVLQLVALVLNLAKMHTTGKLQQDAAAG